MDVHYDTVVSLADRSEIERWISANDSDEIDYITIGETIVSVHGSIDEVSGVTGTAPRQGDVFVELDVARDGLRRYAAPPPS
jgi:hypothetical protein